MRRAAQFCLALLVAVVACQPTAPSPKESTDPDADLIALPSTETAWHETRAIYAVAVRSFQDSDGDGFGDLAGLTTRLRHLRRVGAGAVLLDPIVDTAFRDGPRAAADFSSFDPRVGTTADWDALVTAAAELDLKLIVTLPLNHTGTTHPWFTAAAADTNDTTIPTYRFESTGTTACTDLPPAPLDPYAADDRYTNAGGVTYYHRFATTSPDLDLTTGVAKSAIFAAVADWLDRGADGIYVPHPYAWIETKDTCEDTPESHALLAELRSEVFASRTGKVLLAASHHAARGKIGVRSRPLSYLGSAAAPEADLVLATDLTADLHGAVPTPDRRRDLMDGIAAFAAADRHGMLFPTGTWEMPRAGASIAGTRSFRTMLAIWASAPQTPLLYYGDEVGLGSAGSKIIDFRDFAVPPMPWTITQPNAGFSTGTPWLDLPFNWEESTVAAAADDEGSIYTTLRRWMHLRYANVQWFHAGTFATMLPRDPSTNQADDSVLAWSYVKDGTAILAIHNLLDETRRVTLDIRALDWPKGTQPVDLAKPGRTLPPVDTSDGTYVVDLPRLASMLLSDATAVERGTLVTIKP